MVDGSLNYESAVVNLDGTLIKVEDMSITDLQQAICQGLLEECDSEIDIDNGSTLLSLEQLYLLVPLSKGEAVNEVYNYVQAHPKNNGYVCADNTPVTALDLLNKCGAFGLDVSNGLIEPAWIEIELYHIYYGFIRDGRNNMHYAVNYADLRLAQLPIYKNQNLSLDMVSELAARYQKQADQK